MATNQSYNRQLMPPVVLLPNGTRQPWAQVLDYSLSGGAITINRIAGSAITFSPNSPDFVLAQLDKVPTQQASPVIITDTDNALSFTSLLPNTVNLLDDYAGTLTGTGFDAIINGFRFDDGGGNIVPAFFQLNSQTSSFINTFNTPNPFPVTGTYTLYYTNDGGGSWTTTGLTITCS